MNADFKDLGEIDNPLLCYDNINKKKNVSERQNIERLKNFIEQMQHTDDGRTFMKDVQTSQTLSKIDDHVLRNSKSVAMDKKFNKLKKRIAEEPKTLFLIIHDEVSGWNLINVNAVLKFDRSGGGMC